MEKLDSWIVWQQPSSKDKMEGRTLPQAQTMEYYNQQVCKLTFLLRHETVLTMRSPGEISQLLNGPKDPFTLKKGDLQSMRKERGRK